MNLLEDCYASFINLDERADRRERMTKTLNDAGIVAVRTRGMLPWEYRGPMEKIRCMAQRPQKGAIGCHFTQVNVMTEALRQGRHAFVMEDDLVICSDFQKRMDYITRFCATHKWDVIWMGGTFHVNPPWWHKNTLKRDAELTDDPRMVRTYGAFSTHAYIVNRDSIAGILTDIDKLLPDSMGIDWAFIQLEPKLYTYSFVPGCIIQYDNKSNIGSGITRFSNFKKLGPYWFQDRMEQFDPATFNWAEAKVG